MYLLVIVGGGFGRVCVRLYGSLLQLVVVTQRSVLLRKPAILAVRWFLLSYFFTRKGAGHSGLFHHLSEGLYIR